MDVAIFDETHYVGICDECLQVKTFGTERERELWQNHHAHQEDPA